MISQADILSALQFDNFYDLNPMNITGSARATITYQYAGTSEPDDFPNPGAYTGWTDFTAAEETAFEVALSHIESFLNVDFVELTGASDPTLNVGKVSLPAGTAGYGGYSISWSPTTNDITSYDSYVVYDDSLDLVTQANLFLHELGHALGLKHPFEAPALPADLENDKYTVMSYDANPDNGEFSDAMMLFDVFALQDIWGEAVYNAGDTVYTASRTDTVDAVWDTGGTDIFDASSRTTDVTLNLKTGKFSSFDAIDDVVITYGTRIENATGGSGDDRLVGNIADNVLKGSVGRDTLLGNRGGDTLKGQLGADTIKGHKGRDLLLGGNGNDTLLGGLHKDKLKGGNGNDTLYGQGGVDKFIFTAGDDNDTIADFTDDLDVIKVKNLGDADTVMAAATQVGADVVFDFGGGDTLTVLDTVVSVLSDDMIIV